MPDLVIPAKLAATAVAWEGEGGRSWLARLPRLVAELAAAWDLEVGPPFEPGGNISWVAPARRRHDGLEAVLKVQHPHPESAPEATGLAAWAGNGAVELIDDDPDRCALLIEHCRPGTALLDRGGALDAVRAGAELGAQLHATAPPPGIPSLASVLDAWADELAERLLRPLDVDPGLARRAVATMRERPRACREAALLHGDLNPTNVLAAEREPWLAIDPKPMVGDPAHDGPRLVLQPSPSSAAALVDRIDLVVDAMGVEREALLEWCLVDAVEIGASSRDVGDTATAASCAVQVELLAPLLD